MALLNTFLPLESPYIFSVQEATHVVIWDSRKMRMKTSKAGTAHPNISQIGNGLVTPIGLMNHPLAEVLLTLTPSGTVSF